MSAEVPTESGTGAEAAQLTAEPAEATVTDFDDEAVGAGLDLLDTTHPSTITGRDRLRKVAKAVLPPLLAVVLLIGIWQALWAAALWPEDQLPAPKAVADNLWGLISTGQVLSILYVSVHRGVLGYLVGVAIATPLGLLLAKVSMLRSAFGPLLSALQSLPSVAWVPLAVLWFGPTPPTIYTVILLGSVPSIANGLVAGIDQIPPILPRVGRVLGAGALANARHILLPAALPGYLAGLKQGWAFSWRSLMAAELIANSPQLGLGLGQYLQNGSSYLDMSMIISAIVLILFVGLGVELLVFRPLERRVLRSRGLSGAL
ncbi:MAG TPA: ABC transporter permease [Pseudonocardiaceae bacterium]|jgi:NitT/TauT family transport system permease protein|nr:ABC transporter permease [Pseudonocardiaceae bacterium]